MNHNAKEDLRSPTDRKPKMENPIISEEGRTEIEAHIKEYGVFFVAVADIDPVDQTKDESEKIFTQIHDGYVYTIGFHELGLPEVLVFVGPGGGGGYDRATVDELRDNLQYATNFIRHIYDTRDTFVVDMKAAHAGDAQRESDLYIVAIHDETQDPGEGVKTNLLSGIYEYYGTTDFKVRAFKLRKLTNQH